MRFPTLLIALVSLGTFGALQAEEEPKTALTVEGRVREFASTKGIANIIVTRADTREQRNTGPDGKYTFAGVPAGNLTLSYDGEDRGYALVPPTKGSAKSWAVTKNPQVLEPVEMIEREPRDPAEHGERLAQAIHARGDHAGDWQAITLAGYSNLGKAYLARALRTLDPPKGLNDVPSFRAFASASVEDVRRLDDALEKALKAGGAPSVDDLGAIAKSKDFRGLVSSAVVAVAAKERASPERARAFAIRARETFALTKENAPEFYDRLNKLGNELGSK